MKRWFGFPSVQIALCLVAYALVGYRFGVFALLFALPLFAAVMARSMFALVSNLRQRMLEQVWFPVHGHYYVFKDITIHVLEDDDHCRWVNLLDVQKVLGVTASERALGLSYPGRLRNMGQPAQAHIRDDALVAHLGKENKPTALRFRNWVQRNIVFPGQTIRKRFGLDRPGPTP